MKINTTQNKGVQGLKNLIRLTKPRQESFKEKHERIKQEVLSNLSTNEFIAKSDNPREFNKIIKEDLEK